MKTTTLIFIITIFIFFNFSHKNSKGTEKIQTVDLISNNNYQAQAQIEQTISHLFKSIQNKEGDKVVSFYNYGPKFTEFKNGGLRTGSAESEAYERARVNDISGFNYYLHDLKIDVFENVGKATFHAEFITEINNINTEPEFAQATVVFVKVDGRWKIVHEHFSHLNKEAIASLGTGKYYKNRK